jgi:small subunit ribosomal protein S16
VAVKIKLKRLGKIRAPYYRIIVADARTKRDGRAIEEIGKYHPKAEPSFIEVDSERAQHWLSVGAQPTDPVRKILEITGDWQKFKGLPGTEGTLQTAAPKQDRKEIFAAAVSETLADSGAVTKGRAKAKSGDAAKAAAPAQAKAEKPARGKAAEQPAKGAAEQPAKGKDTAKGSAEAAKDSAEDAEDSAAASAGDEAGGAAKAAKAEPASDGATTESDAGGADAGGADAKTADAEPDAAVTADAAAPESGA